MLLDSLFDMELNICFIFDQHSFYPIETIVLSFYLKSFLLIRSLNLVWHSELIASEVIVHAKIFLHSTVKKYIIEKSKKSKVS